MRPIYSGRVAVCLPRGSTAKHTAQTPRILVHSNTGRPRTRQKKSSTSNAEQHEKTGHLQGGLIRAPTQPRPSGSLCAARQGGSCHRDGGAASLYMTQDNTPPPVRCSATFLLCTNHTRWFGLETEVQAPLLQIPLVDNSYWIYAVSFRRD